MPLSTIGGSGAAGAADGPGATDKGGGVPADPPEPVPQPTATSTTAETTVKAAPARALRLSIPSDMRASPSEHHVEQALPFLCRRMRSASTSTITANGRRTVPRLP